MKAVNRKSVGGHYFISFYIGFFSFQMSRQKTLQTREKMVIERFFVGHAKNSKIIFVQEMFCKSCDFLILILNELLLGFKMLF